MRYFRDVDGREVDFIVTESRRPIMAVESKLSAGPIDRGIGYFVAKFPKVEAWQVYLDAAVEKRYRNPAGIEHAPVERLLRDRPRLSRAVQRS